MFLRHVTSTIMGLSLLASVAHAGSLPWTPPNGSDNRCTLAVQDRSEVKGTQFWMPVYIDNPGTRFTNRSGSGGSYVVTLNFPNANGTTIAPRVTVVGIKSHLTEVKNTDGTPKGWCTYQNLTAFSTKVQCYYQGYLSGDGWLFSVKAEAVRGGVALVDFSTPLGDVYSCNMQDGARIGVK